MEGSSRVVIKAGMTMIKEEDRVGNRLGPRQR